MKFVQPEGGCEGKKSQKAAMQNTVFRMAKTAKISLYNFWIPVVAALLIWLLGISPIWVILVAGIGGFVYGKYLEKKEVQP